MNNIDNLDKSNLDKSNSQQGKSKKFGKLPYIFALSTILSLANPSEMKANEIINNNQQNVEAVSNSNIINNIKMKTGVSLPSPYAQKLENIISINKVMQDKGSAKFIEDFIVKELQKNWWISKENQLLFIRTHIYKEISSKYLYDWSDGDDNRLNEYGDAIEQIEECWKRFRNWYIAYTNQRSAEADKRSAEADKRSAEADKRSAENKQEAIKLTNNWINQLIRFYNLYKRSPQAVEHEEISQMKKEAKDIIQDCKKYNIDYKAKLTKEMLNFYNVE